MKYSRERGRVHHCRGELMGADEVRPAAALRVQRPAGAQGAEDAGKERRMILDPVKCRRAEDQVSAVREGQIGKRRLCEPDP